MRRKKPPQKILVFAALFVELFILNAKILKIEFYGA